MTTRFTMTHDLNCDADRFWVLFFDRAFTGKMFEALELSDFSITTVKDDDKEIVRTVRATPKVEVPGAVRKLLGDRFSYTEEGRYDRTTKTFRFVIATSALKEKLKNEGTVRCEAAGAGKSRRVVEVVIEAKVFGLGGVLESSAEKSYRTTWAKSAEFINTWVKEHP
jgi:hypothetical protein